MRNNYDARSIFRSLGLHRMEQELAVPRSMFSYATSAPNMLATQTIVRAIQNGLVEIGCPVQPTGVMDMDTEACLQQIVGENWQHTSWYRIGKQIVNFRDTGRHIPSVPQSLGFVADNESMLNALHAGFQKRQFIKKAMLLGGITILGGGAYLIMRKK